jgi:hypothetical protein
MQITSALRRQPERLDSPAGIEPLQFMPSGDSPSDSMRLVCQLGSLQSPYAENHSIELPNLIVEAIR